jgi:hypothetical protein
MAPLPLIKIFAVLFKEVAKPVASSLKKQAHEHPTVKQFAMSLGRGYEHTQLRIEAMFQGVRIKEFKPVSDGHALQVGADLLSQGFILSVAIGLVMFEYIRSAADKKAETEQTARRKAARAAIKEDRLTQIELSVLDLQSRLLSIELGLESLQATLEAERKQKRGNGSAGSGSSGSSSVSSRHDQGFMR